MNNRLNTRNAFILSIALGSLLFVACQTGSVNSGEEAQTLCTREEFSQYIGCFGYPPDEFIEFHPWAHQSPPSSEPQYCTGFQFAGEGSGISRELGPAWTFNGNLTGRDDHGNVTADVTYTPGGDGRLTYRSASNELTVEKSPDVNTYDECQPPDACLQHNTANIEGCFRDQSGKHWINTYVSLHACNRVWGIVGGVFADFSGAGENYWQFHGQVGPPHSAVDNYASLDIQSWGGRITGRTIDISGIFEDGYTFLQVIGDDEDLLEPGFLEGVRLLRSDAACPPCSRFRTDRLVGCFGPQGDSGIYGIDIDSTPEVPDSIEIRMSDAEECTIVGEGNGIYSTNSSEWEDWTFSGPVDSDHSATVEVIDPVNHQATEIQLEREDGGNYRLSVGREGDVDFFGHGKRYLREVDCP